MILPTPTCAGVRYSEAIAHDQPITGKMHIENTGDTNAKAYRHSEGERKSSQTRSAKTDSADYRQFVSQRIKASSRVLAASWLQQLKIVVNEESVDIFPTEQYLDHIPSMIEQVGVILDSGNTELTMVNSIISQKAMELGRLRHEQKATISQLLREYDLLARLLGDYQLRWIDEFPGDRPACQILEVNDTISSVIRLILQYTVDAFAERYMTTIEEQTEKLISFNRFVGHEIRSPLNSALLGVDLLLESGTFTQEQTLDIDSVRHSLLEAASVVDSVEKLVSQNKPVSLDSPVRQALPLGPFLSDIGLQCIGILPVQAYQHSSDIL